MPHGGSACDNYYMHSIKTPFDLFPICRCHCKDPEADQSTFEGRPKPFDDQLRKGSAAAGQQKPVVKLGNPFLLRLVETGWPWLVPGGKVPGRFLFGFQLGKHSLNYSMLRERREMKPLFPLIYVKKRHRIIS